TTSALSAATAAVLAALTATGPVVPSLICSNRARATVSPAGDTLPEPSTTWVFCDALVWFAEVAAPFGRTGVLFGLTATTKAGPVATAAVEAAFTAAVFVPSVALMNSARAAASPAF